MHFGLYSRRSDFCNPLYIRRLEFVTHCIALTADKIKEALAEFKMKTGVGMCSWHLKDREKVEESGIECLAELMTLSEATG